MAFFSQKIATQNMLKKTIPDLLRVVREDTERQVAMCALEALHDTYKETDNVILLHSVPELVVQSLTCVKDVFLKKVGRSCGHFVILF